jgi:release factor glutamine methyltransferase
MRTPKPETITFGSLEIRFDHRVLRPRPWTAAHSTWARELIRTAPSGGVLELCAGAGQIGLLALTDTDRRLLCVDVNPAACRFARQNAETAGLADRVEVREGLMDEVLAEHEQFAVVIADPPWVPSSQVRRYPEDPRRAIDGGTDGSDVAATSIGVAHRHLRPGGHLLLQLGNVEQVEKLDRRDGFEIIEVRSYLRGVVLRLDRVPDG